MNIQFFLGAIAQFLVATGRDGALDRAVASHLPIDNPMAALEALSAQIGEVHVGVMGIPAALLPLAIPGIPGIPGQVETIVAAEVGPYPACLERAVDDAEQQVEAALGRLVSDRRHVVTVRVRLYDRNVPGVPAIKIERQFASGVGRMPFKDGIAVTLADLIWVDEGFQRHGGGLWLALGSVFHIEQAALEIPGSTRFTKRALELVVVHSEARVLFPFFAIGDGGASALWVEARLKIFGRVFPDKIFLRASTADGRLRVSPQSPWFWPQIERALPKLRELREPPGPFTFAR
ncbi:MAG TPA: hypothetical protein VJJ47_00185 [Candidatus Paceibacterota bacterium]